MYTLGITIHSQPPHLNIGHLLWEVFWFFHEIFPKYREGNQYRVTATSALRLIMSLVMRDCSSSLFDIDLIVALFLFVGFVLLISILIQPIGCSVCDSNRDLGFGSDTKWYKHWVELILKNWLAMRGCLRVYIHMVKIKLSPSKTQRS
jgi:hypothetical protein